MFDTFPENWKLNFLVFVVTFLGEKNFNLEQKMVRNKCTICLRGREKD